MQTQTASTNIETEQSVELAGDKLRFERDGCRFCLGCPVCSESLEEEMWERGI